MSNVLRIERSGPVGRVWLDRPDVRNALNGVLIRDLAAAFADFAADGGVRAIVLGGSGKAFCAGERAERRRQLADQRAVHGIAHLGTVEPDAGHRAVAFDPQRRRHDVVRPRLSACSIHTQSISGQG